ncbi:MAG: hypothetical protein CMH98_10315 [Oceanospirillaceae bacterium]|nr:hypothetical protein [Oceanospirillaceae bacterium]
MSKALIGDHIATRIDDSGNEIHAIKLGKYKVIHLSKNSNKVVISHMGSFSHGNLRVVNRPDDPGAVISLAKRYLDKSGKHFLNDSQKFVNAVFKGHKNVQPRTSNTPDTSNHPKTSTQVGHISSLKPGDHLVSPRKLGLYHHHGIYIGNGVVIHYSGWAGNTTDSKVAKTTLKSFHDGNGYHVVPHPDAKVTKEEAVKRAKRRLGEDAYYLFSNNCEHFVNWCIDKNHHSQQVDIGTSAGTVPGAATLGTAGRAVVAATGSVAGTSGAGIMSGLATVGRVVTLGTGGAAAGIGALGAASGTGAAALLNNTVLKDDEHLEDDEREARSIGRKATYAGAVAGSAGSVAAVSAAGSTAGLSAAGISSGLTAIGSAATGGLGGMAAGVAVTTAAPAVAAVAVGYGLYKVAKWFSD